MEEVTNVAGDGVLGRLRGVQMALKAPKDRYNSFGKYKYRSCEGILEAVKPLLDREGLTLTLTDEIVPVGARYYVKATATVSSGDKSVMTWAYAREDESKKGMDGSQVTGTASSYARKYALNGLFLIDDSKDADTDEYHAQTAGAGSQRGHGAPQGGQRAPQGARGGRREARGASGTPSAANGGPQTAEGAPVNADGGGKPQFAVDDDEYRLLREAFGRLMQLRGVDGNDLMAQMESELGYGITRNIVKDDYEGAMNWLMAHIYGTES